MFGWVYVTVKGFNQGRALYSVSIHHKWSGFYRNPLRSGIKVCLFSSLFFQSASGRRFFLGKIRIHTWKTNVWFSWHLVYWEAQSQSAKCTLTYTWTCVHVNPSHDFSRTWTFVTHQQQMESWRLVLRIPILNCFPGIKMLDQTYSKNSNRVIKKNHRPFFISIKRSLRRSSSATFHSFRVLSEHKQRH